MDLQKSIDMRSSLSDLLRQEVDAIVEKGKTRFFFAAEQLIGEDLGRLGLAACTHGLDIQIKPVQFKMSDGSSNEGVGVWLTER